MKIFIYSFIILSTFSFLSCSNETTRGLSSLNKNWQKKEITYWIQKSDSTEKEIKSIEGLDIDKKNYTIDKKYEIQINNRLKIKKSILFNPYLNKKVHEADYYEHKINSDIRSKLYLSYDYESKMYSITLRYSIATIEKWKKNRVKLDSMHDYAKKNNLYLCGTAANEILREGLPHSRIEEISLESAEKIIVKWTNQ